VGGTGRNSNAGIEFPQSSRRTTKKRGMSGEDLIFRPPWSRIQRPEQEVMSKSECELRFRNKFPHFPLSATMISEQPCATTCRVLDTEVTSRGSTSQIFSRSGFLAPRPGMADTRGTDPRGRKIKNFEGPRSQPGSTGWASLQQMNVKQVDGSCQTKSKQGEGPKHDSENFPLRRISVP
jgi:hypothetical protein